MHFSLSHKWGRHETSVFAENFFLSCRNQIFAHLWGRNLTKYDTQKWILRLCDTRVVKIVARIWILGHFLENIQRAGHVIPKNMMKSQCTVYVYYGIVLNITSL